MLNTSFTQAPAVSNFASINSTVGTSILDRAASVTPVAGIVSVDVSALMPYLISGSL